MIYKILKYPTKSLLDVSSDVNYNTDNIKEIAIHIVNMLHTLLNTNGIGLASPQVGINKRIIVLTNNDTDIDYKNENYVNEVIYKINNTDDLNEIENLLYNIDYLINPVIIKSSDNKISINEGCLSVPDIVSNIIKRPDSVIVEFKTITNKIQQQIFNNVGSVCVQHEIDHLNGKLFFMNLNFLHKTKLMKKYKHKEK